MRKGDSMYAPYYAKIQDLLFQGMEQKEAWAYMRIFFGVYGSYSAFWHYVKVSGLRWFIPLKVKGQGIEKSTEISGQ